MEPVISPWVIYWIGIACGECVGWILIAVFGMIGIVFYHIAKCIDGDCDSFIKFQKKAKGLIRTVHIAVIFSILWLVFIPSRETIIAMVVAKNVTYDRVVIALDAGKNFREIFKQDLIDVLTAINESEENKEGK